MRKEQWKRFRPYWYVCDDSPLDIYHTRTGWRIVLPTNAVGLTPIRCTGPVFERAKDAIRWLRRNQKKMLKELEEK